MEFNYVGILVIDIDCLIVFYCDLFGMKQFCDVFFFGGEQFLVIMDILVVMGWMCMMGGGLLQFELFEFIKL